MIDVAARRTLVVGPNWVGDTVMALPVLDALAASGREVHVLAKPHLAPLLGLFASVTSTVERSGDDDETVAALRRLAAAEAVVLPNSFHSAWFPYRAGVPRRWGYPGGWRRLLLRPVVRRPTTPRHQVDDYRELLAAMEVPAAADPVPRLTLDAEHRRRGAEILDRAGVDGDGEIVGLFPGAEFGRSKRWPLGRFVEASKALSVRRPGARQVIVAGPKEVWLAVLLHEQTGKVHPVVGPDLDLAALAAVLAHLAALITNDSGPMHLAAALGVRCVVPFGPTDPSRTAPLGRGHTVLHRDLWCTPCFRRRCPLLHHRCMKGIGSETVVDAAVVGLETAEPAAG